MRTWLKYCGLCDARDFTLAISLGVDAVGLICVPDSPRFVNSNELAKLAAYPRRSSKLILVFQDAAMEFIHECIAISEPDVLQFHGNEEPEFAESFGYHYIKAVRGREHIAALHAHTEADAWIVDDPGYMRNELFQAEDTPLILAGGLTVENVQERIREVRPFGVDVARGIEISPRKKDPLKMIEFQHLVRSLETV